MRQKLSLFTPKQITGNLFTLLLLFVISCNSTNEKAGSGKADKKVIRTDKAPQPVGPYSQGILVNDVMYVSGQVGISPSTNQLDTSGFEAQAYQALRNIVNVLEAGGMTADNVVSTRVYLTDMDDFIVLNEVYKDFFSKNLPARETVQVCELPKEASIEISVVAVR
ncbi:MAG: Rid family detoxifying hydrolase [Flavobacteriales bacterium]